MGVTLKIRSYYSDNHIRSAAFFARSSFRIESKANKDSFEDKFSVEHRAYVTGALFFVVAFLEATINELFADAADESSKNRHVKELGENAREKMGKIWKFGAIYQKLGTLEKFDLALLLSDNSAFDQGKTPYQDMKLLIALRNTLTHYIPEWILANSPTHIEEKSFHKIEKRLQGKFDPNPFIDGNKPFYPHRCISHGCAAWGVNTGIAFVDQFYKRMAMTSSIKALLPFLKTK